jgi:VanZ family protein
VKRFLKYWLPVFIWMTLIFSASADSKSVPRSSRIIGPVLHWLFPRMSDESIKHVVIGVRKCAHLGEYAVFSLLLWRAFRKPERNDPRPWSWPLARRVILLAALYAATDEFHQHFVAGRGASVWDALLDTAGAACGMYLLWRLWRWRNPAGVHA